MSETPSIVFGQSGGGATVTLNRPQAMNALDLGMIRALAPKLRQWENNNATGTVIMRGAGDKAFCSGGDIRAAWDAMKAARGGDEKAAKLTRDYFREEYQLNAQLKNYSKPVIALIDGICMGGGVGLSAHGAYCVATERTSWAMPEMAIGFITDVGASYLLSRLPDGIGFYLAMTGTRLNAADCLALGLATHGMISGDLKRFTDTLLAKKNIDSDAIEEMLDDFRFDPGQSPVEHRRQQIAECFHHKKSVEAIIASLEKDKSEWAQEQIATLRRVSPTSLKLCHRLLTEASAIIDFEDCLKLEYRLSQACVAGHDFYEGVRAQLVDKDRNPKWQPPRLEDVTPVAVERHFCFDAEPITFAE
jgi:enoyl-CoA hydratase